LSNEGQFVDASVSGRDGALSAVGAVHAFIWHWAWVISSLLAPPGLAVVRPVNDWGETRWLSVRTGRE
jgi:hypothetical protein